MVEEKSSLVSEFKQSFIKSLINNFLRTVKVFDGFAFNPLLNRSEIVTLGHLAPLLLQPAGEVGEKSHVEVTDEDPIDDVAEKYLYFEFCPFSRAVGELPMDFFINSADSVAISYFELGEVLILGVEAVLEVRKRFFFFTLLDLLD